jgi:YD repeat-containing protein
MILHRILYVSAVLTCLMAGVGVPVRTAASVLVRLSNQNLSVEFTDIAVTSDREDYMRIKRVYNSNSPFNHVFGFGWGTESDTNLLPLPDGELWYTAFGNGLSSEFSETSSSDPAKMLNEIETGTLQEGLIGSADEKEAYSNLPQWAVMNSYQALRYSGYLAPSEIAAGHLLTNHDTGPARVFAVPEGYQLFILDSPASWPFEALFDNGGKLIRAWVHDQPHRFVSYQWKSLKGKFLGDSDRIFLMTDYRGNLFRLSYDNSGRVTRIDAGRFGSAQYSYDRSGNLISVRDKSGTLGYTYDVYHDLTRIDYPQGGSVTFQYEGGSGYLTSLQCRDGKAYEFQRLSGEAGAATSMRIVTKEGGAETTEVVNDSDLGVRGYCS